MFSSLPSYRDVVVTGSATPGYTTKKHPLASKAIPSRSGDSLVSMANTQSAPAAKRIDALTPSSSFAKPKDKSILVPQKPTIIGWVFSLFFGTQSTTAIFSTRALTQEASLTQLVDHTSNSFGIGYFFYNIGSFVNAFYKVCKKFSLPRIRKIAQETVTLGSATLGAVVSLAQLGCIAIRTASTMIGQVVFGVLNIVNSLLSIIEIVRFARAKKHLNQLSPETGKNELTLQLKEILSNTKAMRRYLKGLFPNALQLQQFNQLVVEEPSKALVILKRSSKQALVREAFSLASNLCFSVAAIVGVFFPPVGLILGIVGGTFMVIDWILGKFLAKSSHKQLQEFAQNSPKADSTILAQ